MAIAFNFEKSQYFLADYYRAIGLLSLSCPWVYRFNNGGSPREGDHLSSRRLMPSGEFVKIDQGHATVWLPIEFIVAWPDTLSLSLLIEEPEFTGFLTLGCRLALRCRHYLGKQGTGVDGL